MAKERASSVVRRESDVHPVRNAGPPQLLEQLDDVHFALRPFREPAKLGEFLRQSIQPVRFRREHLNRHVRPCGRPAVRPFEGIHRNPHRGQRILDLMCDAPCHFAEGAQAFGLELALARRGQGRGQLAQRLAQRFEFRSAACGQAGGQRFMPPNELRPAHHLIDGSGELAGEMAGQIDRGVERRHAEQENDDRKAGRVVAQERLGAPRQADRRGDFIEMLAQEGALAYAEMQRVHAFEQCSRGGGNPFGGYTRTRRGQQPPDRQDPPRNPEHRRHRGHDDEDQEDSPPEGKRHI